MKKCLLLTIGLVLSAAALSSQGKAVIVVKAFTTASGVDLPYDMKLMQTQLVPEFKVMLGKEFDRHGGPHDTSWDGLYARC